MEKQPDNCNSTECFQVELTHEPGSLRNLNTRTICIKDFETFACLNTRDCYVCSCVSPQFPVHKSFTKTNRRLSLDKDAGNAKINKPRVLSLGSLRFVFSLFSFVNMSFINTISYIPLS